MAAKEPRRRCRVSSGWTADVRITRLGLTVSTPMNRPPVSPLVLRALEVPEKHLGMEELSKRLGVSPMEIQFWRAGQAEVPDRKFLLLVDLLIELDPKWLDKDETP